MDELTSKLSSLAIKIENDKWIDWPEETKNIPYKTNIKGQGPGEDRIAHLFHTTPKGQNLPYDIDLPNYYQNTKGEVKELDSADTFRTGRDGRDRLRPIKTLIMTLVDTINRLISESSEYIDDAIKRKMVCISKISPDEICKSNVSLINDICKYLHDLKQLKYNDLPNVDIFNSITGLPTKVNMLMVYNIMVAEEQPELEIKKKLGSHFDKIRLLTYLKHTYIIYPAKFMDDLNGICDIFNLSTLIFVNKKGYYILCSNIKEKICFERITLGNPRFKVHLEKL